MRWGHQEPLLGGFFRLKNSLKGRKLIWGEGSHYPSASNCEAVGDWWKDCFCIVQGLGTCGSQGDISQDRVVCWEPPGPQLSFLLPLRAAAGQGQF